MPSAKKKQAAKVGDTIDTLARTVQTYMACRQEHLPTREDPIVAAATARVASFKVLDELRARIADMEKELATATGSNRTMLQEDLELYVEERRRLVDQLGRRTVKN